MLLDLHPEPRRVPVAVRTGAGTTRVGALAYSASFIQTIAAANDALVALEREGIFVREQQLEYEVLTHFDSVVLWRSYLEAEAPYYLPADEAMLRSIERAQSAVIVAEWIRGTRFRRLG
ncbi:MAG: hypothetical protein IH869_02865 [Chloroflexi bacterium]|nr:hypothetical protein [Chloroflexota bacterium]